MFSPDEQRDDHGKWTSGAGGASTPEQANAHAKEVAGKYQPLPGLPQTPIKLGDEYYTPGPIERLKMAADNYMAAAGLKYAPPQTYAKLDKDRAKRIADAFEAEKHDPNDPKVKASYEALAKETLAQWDELKKTGLKVEWVKPGMKDPYADSPRRAAMDVANNNHWWGYPTDLGFGSDEESKSYNKDNPLLKETGEVIDGRKVVVNDVFRIVHDMFGHLKEGNGFRAEGEENAWRSHAAMFSDLARPAMTNETRGQNSWVNFGPYGETNRHASAADTHFAPQKIGLLPDWATEEGRND